MDKPTSEQVVAVPNPEGKGGFKDHPENINAGGRPHNQESFVYWYGQFKNMTVEEFKAYEKTKPDGQRTVAESLAYARVVKARSDLKEFKEVADRSEGRPVQRTDITSGGDKLPIALVEFLDGSDPSKSPDTS